MKHQTRDIMIGISLVLNVLLAGALLYDYTQNDARYTVGILAVYFVFTLVYLFMWGLTRREEVAVDAITTYVMDTGHVGPLAAAKPVAFVPDVPSAPVVPTAPVVPDVKPAAEPEAGAVPFLYEGFTLYGRAVDLQNGGTRTIYFFSKRKPASGSPIAKPDGFHVGVNERTGLPFLKRGIAKDGEDLTPTIEEAYRPQCVALTDAGHQCRNSSRHGSKYCASHFGYQPTTIAKAEARREDTLPRVPEAPDTIPSVRRKAGARKA